MKHSLLPYLLLATAATSALACSSTSEGPRCRTDDREPNDSPSAAADLGEFTDNPNSSQSLDLAFSSGQDVDFFRVRVKDLGAGGDPIITVSAPSGYEVTMWRSCDTGSLQATECSRGETVDEPAIMSNKGCKSVAPSASVSGILSCSDTDDDHGSVLVRITRLDTSASCSDYNVTFEVE